MRLKREVRFEEGHDCITFECKHGSEQCVPKQGGSHGRHGLTIRWILRGPHGGVTFVLFTGWLPAPPEWWDRDKWGERLLKGIFPMPADVGSHAKKARYEEQHATDNCEVTGGKCYFDGSALQAQQPFRVLCNEGGEALWKWLEGYYMYIFKGGTYPEVPEYKWKERGK